MDEDNKQIIYECHCHSDDYRDAVEMAMDTHNYIGKLTLDVLADGFEIDVVIKRNRKQ